MYLDKKIMSKKILVINDSESLSEVLQFYLEMENYEVVVALNGGEGLEKATQTLPDLILLDVLMPDMNGFDVCLKLKSHPKTADIPVLFLSSLTATEDKVQGLASGGVDFINNMADQPEVLARIATHLKMRELTQKLQISNQELLLKQQRVTEDLHAAANIQRSLLPAKELRLPPSIETSWSCQPSQWVGGDICNIIAIPKAPYLIVYMLDVSGHGVPSAMATVSITQYLHQVHLTRSFLLSPKEILESLNQEYPFEKYQMFFSFCYLLVNTENGELIYGNAGHPPAIYSKKEHALAWLESTGPLIGLQERASFEERTLSLTPGDRLILYTDGVTEYRNALGELFGEKRLASLIEQYQGCSLQELLDNTLIFLKEFGRGLPPVDDVSLLMMQYNGQEQKKVQ